MLLREFHHSLGNPSPASEQAVKSLFLSASYNRFTCHKKGGLSGVGSARGRFVPDRAVSGRFGRMQPVYAPRYWEINR